ncbi:enoyl-CoA hydratase [Tomitella gaofuii]|uniref:enoyl-CoA hydratase n=1 Tax=Tomitella gaofuii TaxID=2760083 RepID=UPI0015FB5AA0|nr:enoyl-CoA hydratase [Tomitella gaofuii]
MTGDRPGREFPVGPGGVRSELGADGILRITLCRPERLNALDSDVIAELSAALRRTGDPTVRVVVLTGEGRAFCTGADLSTLDGDPKAMMDAANALIRAVVSAPVPVIAAVNGPAAGFAVGLSCAADLIYAAESAYFLLPFITIGLMPDGGATALVTGAIGRARAAEMAMLGERLPAAEAFACGLVTRTVPDAELSAYVEQVAARLAVGPCRALELTKRALAATSLDQLDTALDREREGQIELLGSADAAEGVAAAMQKRRPRFGV